MSLDYLGYTNYNFNYGIYYQDFVAFLDTVFLKTANTKTFLYNDLQIWIDNPDNVNYKNLKYGDTFELRRSQRSLYLAQGPNNTINFDNSYKNFFEAKFMLVIKSETKAAGENVHFGDQFYLTAGDYILTYDAGLLHYIYKDLAAARASKKEYILVFEPNFYVNYCGNGCELVHANQLEKRADGYFYYNNSTAYNLNDCNGQCSKSAAAAPLWIVIFLLVTICIMLYLM